MFVSKILKGLHQERVRLQRELATVTAVIDQLELLERDGPRRRGRPRRLSTILKADPKTKFVAAIAEKSA